MKRTTGLVAALLAALVVVPAAAADDASQKLEITVVSSPAKYVSGDDARIEIAVPRKTALGDVDVTLNGTDVTSAFGPDPEGNHQLEGVVTGLPLGESRIVASSHEHANGKKHRDELELVNNPLQGPIFSGPHQKVFLCSTAGNAANNGLPPIPQSPTCETPTVVSFIYRNTAGDWLPYNPAAPPDAATIAQTTTMDGKNVPMIVRWERGVINRFMYSIMMLSPASQTSTPDFSAWNHKLLFSFSGGVAIGHYQGSPSVGDMRYLNGLQMGYAVIYSTGTRTNTHYNLQLGGETAIMVKDRFISAYAEPEYTVAVGGSGGAIQQYVYGQNHPGLIDAGVPQYSYSDMVTQTIHVGDCELVERWLDSKVLADPLSMWRTWLNRTLIEGLSSSSVMPNPYAAVMPYMPTPGSTECINGWRGLSPLALNPHFGTAPGYDPAVYGPVEWTHWGDLVNIYGTDETGFARSPWDNVGVQYGLAAVKSGAITPEQFLDLNANVGSWKRSADMVQEGCPYILALCATQLPDVWSARNMQLSPDGGASPASRLEGDQKAQYAAYRSGMVFRGKLDIPVIDWRHYLEPFLDMHNSHQSFATRQRLLNYDGDASNQVIWFTAVPAAGAPALRPDAAGAPRARSLAREHRRPPGAGRLPGTSPPTRSTPASTWTARCVRAVRASGTESSTTVRRASAPRTSRRLRRRGSSRAGRSRAASSSARRSPSTARSNEGCTASGTRPRPSARGCSRSSRRGSATTRSRTRVCRRSSGRGTDEGNGRPPRAAARVRPIAQLLRVC